MVGSIVETCSLLPGVVMKVDGDDIEVRMLCNVEYNGKDFSCCSISHCGIRVIDWSLAMKIATIGKPRISELYQADEETDDGDHDKFYQKYDKRIEAEYEKMILKP